MKGKSALVLVGAALIIVCLLAGCKPPKRNLAKELFSAAGLPDVQKVQQLLKEGANPNAKDEKGHTVFQSPLIMLEATRRSNELKKVADELREVIRILLEAGADPNAADSGGTTALMSAAICGDEEVIYLLIKHGADLNRRDKNGHTAVWYAATYNHPNLASDLRYLSEAQPKPSPDISPTPSSSPSKLRERVTELWSGSKPKQSPSPR